MTLPDRLLDAVRAACGEGGTIEEPERLRTYECDGLTGHRAIPALVCLPPTAEAVQAVVRACHADGIPFVARGAGTGLSGGALPVVGGVVISVARMRRILEVDLDGGRVVVEPGVANLEVTRAVAPHGYFYAPDPSSQQVCTIGGNVAENSGGAHCLKHGFTVNHVCGLSIVLSDGELVELGGKGLDEPGPDLLGAFVGSEGTLGIAVRITLRIVRRPEQITTFLASFDSTDEAGGAVSDIVAAGILPAAIEMMDRLTIEAAEAAVHAGYPEGAGAILITELDGVTEQVARGPARRRGHLPRSNGCREIRVAARRRGARASSGRGGRPPSPPSAASAPTTTSRTASCRARSCPPCSGGSSSSRSSTACASATSSMPATETSTRSSCTTGPSRARPSGPSCAPARSSTPASTAGGSITGEHGVGVDKACAMSLMFTPDDLAVMSRVRRAFDPAGLANPGKLLPTPRLCGEAPGPAPHASAGEGRPCRASLSRRPSTSSSGAAARGGRRRPRASRSDAPGGDVEVSLAHLDRVLAHEAGDLTVTVEAGMPPLGAACAARAAPPGARARPARRPDDRRLPRRRPLGPAAPPLRRPARPAARRHARARRRHGRERRAARSSRTSPATTSASSSAARHGRFAAIARREPAAASAAGGGRDGRRRRARARGGGAPRARRRALAARADRLRPRLAGPPAAALRGWRGGRRGAGRRARATSLGARPVDDAVWDEVRERQASAAGRLAYPPGELAGAARPRADRRSSASASARPTCPTSPRILARSARSGSPSACGRRSIRRRGARCDGAPRASERAATSSRTACTAASASRPARRTALWGEEADSPRGRIL